MSAEEEYKGPCLETLRDLPLSVSKGVAIHSLGESAEHDLKLSHKALRSCCARLSNSLTSRPLSPGSVVAIVLPNSPEFITTFLAVTAIGGVAAPLNSKYTTDEFTFYLKDAGVNLVILPHDIPTDAPIVLAATALNIDVLNLPNNLFASIEQGTEYPTTAGYIPSSSTTAMFLHTSGTTSRPKGVPLTHGNLCTSIGNIARTYELCSSDRSLLVMPLFHVHGLMSATLSTLATGGTVILPPGGRFSATVFWSSVTRGGATWFTAVPTIHQILLARADEDYPKTEAPNLRFMRSCSASLAPSVLERLEKTFNAPVLEAYAMTEAAHQMTSNPLPKHGARRPGSVGKAQNVAICVLDEGNERVANGVIGEICIRGENVMKGYQNNDDANLTAFAAGWFHTGDQGFMDDEGYVTLTGRIKELVNRGGEKISPLEVDAVLLAHDAVMEAVSFAVKDEKYGEEVNAAVILKKGSGIISENELMEFAKGKLAAFKIPKKMFICHELPRTATGKIQRRIVAKHFVGGD